MYHSLLSAYVGKIDAGYVYEELWTEYASAFLSKVFLFSALFVAVTLLFVGAFVRKKRPEAFSTYVKVSVGIAVAFALTVILSMLSLGFAKIAEKGYLQERSKLLVLLPPVVLSAIAILGGVASYVGGLFSKKAEKIALGISASLLIAALIGTLVCLIVYFNGNIKNDGYYDTADGSYGKVNQLVLFLASVLLIAAMLAVAFLCDKKGDFRFDGKSVALAGICVSLSFALSYIKIWDLPQGGSVTLVSLLPVALYGYLCGAKKGVFVGLVYGLLQSMQDPYIIHPAQYLLDYPVAFAAAGLAGVFRNAKGMPPQVKFVLGALLVGLFRYTAHTVSGIFAFGAYAVDAGAANAFVYSAAYNSFVFIDILLVAAAGAVLLSSKSFAAETAKYSAAKSAAVEKTKNDKEES